MHDYDLRTIWPLIMTSWPKDHDCKEWYIFMVMKDVILILRITNVSRPSNLLIDIISTEWYKTKGYE
jgi:hypothetical protein